MNIGKLHHQRDRAVKAQSLLENELLIEGFEALEQMLTEAWKKSKPGDTARREDAWRSLILLGKLRNGLESHVRTGRLAEKQLLDLKQPRNLRNVIHG